MVMFLSPTEPLLLRTEGFFDLHDDAIAALSFTPLVFLCHFPRTSTACKSGAFFFPRAERRRKRAGVRQGISLRAKARSTISFWANRIGGKLLSQQNYSSCFCV